ncbi:MAG TPA: hypothetical protein VER36_04135 [Flavisolibacter sp.]|nr:hypothetical protein [Flavisolibacter sp.]
MKRRYRYMLNLASFGLLLFALYLNFVKREPADVSGTPASKESSVGTLKEGPKTSAVNHSAESLGLK